MVTISLNPADESLFRFKSRENFFVKSDNRFFNNSKVQYWVSGDWRNMSRVNIELSGDAETEYENIMQNGIDDYKLDDYLRAMYRDILKPISENIEEGMLDGGILLREYNVRFYIAPNWVVIDKEFPYAKFMIGVGNELIDICSDNVDASSEIVEIVKFSKSFRQLMERINFVYDNICFRITDRVRMLKDTEWF